MFLKRSCVFASSLLKSNKTFMYQKQGAGKISATYLCTTSSDTEPLKIDVTSASTTSYRGPCTISGWIKSAKHQSKHTFLHLTDGLSNQHIQIVLPDNVRGDVSEYKFGASVKVNGTITDSPARGQKIEVQAAGIELLGYCDNETYPFSNAKKRYTADYVRKYLHLRAKKPEFAAMLRLRGACRRAICDYFHHNNYIQIDTPILTSNDCEGAGETFSVGMTNSGKKKEPYFGKERDVKLAVSGQLHLEVCNSGDSEKFIFCCFICSLSIFIVPLYLVANFLGISKVFTFSPAFRADNAIDQTHLAEFYMVEGEMAFINELEDLMAFVEHLTKSVAATILENEQEDITALLQGSTR